MMEKRAIIDAVDLQLSDYDYDQNDRIDSYLICE